MMICKIQLRTENQLGKGQEEKVLLPFSKDTRCNLIQNSRVIVKSSWVPTYRMDVHHNKNAGSKNSWS